MSQHYVMANTTIGIHLDTHKNSLSCLFTSFWCCKHPKAVFFFFFRRFFVSISFFVFLPVEHRSYYRVFKISSTIAQVLLISKWFGATCKMTVTFPNFFQSFGDSLEQEFTDIKCTDLKSNLALISRECHSL